jgi:hypothetical protein
MEALQDQSAPQAPTIDISPTRPSSPPQNEISSPNEPPASGRLDHSSSMCEEAFDRPSALKQVHPPSLECTIVHTGEDCEFKVSSSRAPAMLSDMTLYPALVCDICDCRFSTASNLNCHVGQCHGAYRPVNTIDMDNTSASSGEPPNDSDLDTASTTSSQTLRSGSEGHDAETLSETTPSPPAFDSPRSPSSLNRTSTLDPNYEANAPRQEPIPTLWIPLSLQKFDLAPVDPDCEENAPHSEVTPIPWIPLSLRNFDLTPSRKSCPVPLVPILPSPRDGEERDSFCMDELVGRLCSI